MLWLNVSSSFTKFSFSLPSGRSYGRHGCNHRACIAIKAGVHLKPVFPPRNLGLMRISRSRFKHSQNPLFIPQSYVKRCFVNVLVIFGDVWKEIVFLKGLVKFGEIRNIKDLM